MRYDIATGVKRQQIKLKTLIISVLASAGMVGGMAVPALAAAPGYDTARSNTDCADHGAFLADGDSNYGWLGRDHKGGTPGYHDGQGQDEGATGYNNSHLCGNPQN